ncbi:MAG: LytTR family transcriptional regulator DNA-binding domain-containing protein [Burkholderiales bacterium]|nr:LytTR family transcriptional regulator DNA-binding domain-containing protein [Burkholderiales bacterium]
MTSVAASPTANATAVPPPLALDRLDVGVVQLDAQRHVVAMNEFARRVLPVEARQPFERMVLSFHPERSQPKVLHLLDQAAECPVANPPPMAMIINIPERVLLIKVTRMAGADRQGTGYVLVFYDITETVSAGDGAPPLAGARRQLLKLPTVAEQKIVLVDAEAVLCIRSDGHYTRVVTAQATRFCNLAIGDLETRLDPELFLRVHRTHIVNLRAVAELQRSDGRLALRLHGQPETVPVSRSSQADVLARFGLPSAAAAPRQG